MRILDTILVWCLVSVVVLSAMMACTKPTEKREQCNYTVVVHMPSRTEAYCVSWFEPFHESYMLGLYDGRTVYVPQSHTVIKPW